MEESITTFAEQFTYQPEVINGENMPVFSKFVFCGMGGSHLQAHILKGYSPDIDLTIHSDYGVAPEAHVPPADKNARDDTLFIASSYSGNTEEVVDFLKRAHTQDYHVAVSATGGQLLEYATKYNLPYIQLPDTGIQPRTALGFSLRALMKFVRPDLLSETAELAHTLKPLELREEGEEIGETLRDHIPVICASTPNQHIAYNWKIKFNETGKIPAFYNVFPELNHNEMQGYDRGDSNRHVSERLRFIFIHDSNDHERIQQRMDIVERQYEERGFEVISVHLTGATYWGRVFNSLLTADWAALKIAQMYGVEPEQVPMIEEFKKKLG